MDTHFEFDSQELVVCGYVDANGVWQSAWGSALPVEENSVMFPHDVNALNQTGEWAICEAENSPSEMILGVDDLFFM